MKALPWLLSRQSVLTIGAGKSLATVTLAFAYAGFVIVVASTQFGLTLLGWAAPLGRMAFTNYLAQSLIFGWVFYGYGLGLFGKLGASSALTLGVALYVAQVIFSRWWLKRYLFGPVEWLWRTLMYGTLQPMKLSAKPAAAATLSLKACDSPVQIVLIGTLDLGRYNLAHTKRSAA